MYIKDLYYILRLDALLEKLHILLELDLVRFRDISGISADYCLLLLDLYLGSTYVSVNGKLFI